MPDDLRGRTGVPSHDSESIDLVWPPSDRELDAITIIDLQAPTAVVVRPRPTAPPLIVRDAARPLVHHWWRPAWALAIGLLTVELASVHVGRTLDTVPFARIWMAPGVIHARPVTRRVQSVRPRVAAEDEPEPYPIRRVARRSTLPPTKPAAARSEADEVAMSIAVPRDPISLESHHAFVPARVIANPRPRHVPSPFPVPRGSRTSLELVIDESGHVAAARIASSGAGFYDAPLLEAARGWRFEPARADGRPTRSVQTVQVAVP